MINKYIIVFCEGDHDIAFLSKILFVHGFTSYGKRVNEFDKPLNNLYIKNLSQKKIGDMEFKFQRPKRKVPYIVLIKNDILVIFHNFDGDGNFTKDGAKSIIKMYIDLNKENRRKIDKYEKLNYRFLYFLDSDDKGVDNRLSELQKSIEIDTFNSHVVYKYKDYEIGAYIFYDETNSDKYGKLEDILLNLMKKSNEKVFANSTEYINKNILETKRQKKFIYIQDREEYIGRVEFKKSKSIISSAGQLQFSGSSNAVIIANSDYIKKDDILNSQVCQDIIKLFK